MHYGLLSAYHLQLMRYQQYAVSQVFHVPHANHVCIMYSSLHGHLQPPEPTAIHTSRCTHMQCGGVTRLHVSHCFRLYKVRAEQICAHASICRYSMATVQLIMAS